MLLVILLIFVAAISRSKEDDNKTTVITPPVRFSYSFIFEKNKIEVDEGNLCINDNLVEKDKPSIPISNVKIFLIMENEGRSLRLVNPKENMDVLIVQLDKDNKNNPSILILPTKQEAGFRRYVLGVGTYYKYILEYSFEGKEPSNMKSIVDSFIAKEKK
jgi:hypothetical protein